MELYVQFESSSEMIESLLSCVSKSLGDAAEREPRDKQVCRIEILGQTNDRFEAIKITLAEDKFVIPLMHGVSAAAVKHKDIVLVSGSDSLIGMLVRLPGFQPPPPLGQAPVPRPLPPSRSVDENPKLTMTLDELNEFLTSWIFVSDVAAALKVRFASAAGERIEKFEPLFLHGADPCVHAVYRELIRQWSKVFYIPDRLISATRLMFGALWTSDMEEWLTHLRANFDVRVSDKTHPQGAIVCEIWERNAVLKLAENAFLCLGNFISGASKKALEFIDALPDAGSFATFSNTYPENLMFQIHTMVLNSLGYISPSSLKLNSEKPAITFNNFGQMYVTIAGRPPFHKPMVEVARRALVAQSNLMLRELHELK